jgi:hypothetical protein
MFIESSLAFSAVMNASVTAGQNACGMIPITTPQVSEWEWHSGGDRYGSRRVAPCGVCHD